MCVAMIVLAACQPEQSGHSPDATIAFMSPKNSLVLGRQSAIIQHLSRHWQVSDIDGIATAQKVILDFSTIADARAKASINDCAILWLEFDQEQLAVGNLQVIHIKRVPDDGCSGHFDGLMMAILGDVQWLQKDDDGETLILSSYQHTLTLTPYP